MLACLLSMCPKKLPPSVNLQYLMWVPGASTTSWHLGIATLYPTSTWWWLSEIGTKNLGCYSPSLSFVPIRHFQRLFFNLSTSVPTLPNIRDWLVYNSPSRSYEASGRFPQLSILEVTSTTLAPSSRHAHPYEISRWHSHFCLLVCLFFFFQACPGTTWPHPLQSLHIIISLPSYRISYGTFLLTTWNVSRWNSTQYTILKNWRWRSISAVTLVKVGLRSCLRSSFLAYCEQGIMRLKVEGWATCAVLGP